jgi:ATP adenylyltransferase
MSRPTMWSLRFRRIGEFGGYRPSLCFASRKYQSTMSISLPDTFYQTVLNKFEAAVKDGSLVYTPSEMVSDQINGMNVRYTLARALIEKPAGGANLKPIALKEDRRLSPWIHPEATLLVTSGTKYLTVLNKFAVSKGHFLVVTKDYERQTAPLSEEDFQASFAVLKAVNSQSGIRHIGFFNSGPDSGASVEHKHIQFLPLPQDGFKPFPDNIIKATYINGEDPLHDDNLPFAHFVVPTPEQFSGEELAFRYSTLMARVMTVIGKNGMKGLSYNLVFTEEWMMAVPRQTENIEGRSVNALGTIGMFLAKTDKDLEFYKQVGPMKILQTVGFPFEKIDGCAIDSVGYIRY